MTKTTETRTNADREGGQVMTCAHSRAPRGAGRRKAAKEPRAKRRRARCANPRPAARPESKTETRDPFVEQEVMSAAFAAAVRRVGGERARWSDYICSCPKRKGGLMACSERSLETRGWKDCKFWREAALEQQRAPMLSREWRAFGRGVEADIYARCLDPKHELTMDCFRKRED